MMESIKVLINALFIIKIQIVISLNVVLCRCCTCNHNNINDPNLPFGAVGDKLKKSLQNLPSSIGKYEPLNPGDYSINGNKGIYDCYFKDKNGYGYKLNINCEQIPFPKGITPKKWRNWNISRKW